MACPPGMFRDIAPLCQLCGKGRYTEGFGSSTCSTCPAGQYTLSLGVRSSKECKSGSSGNRYSGNILLDICNCRVAFATENVFAAWSKHNKHKLSSINRGYNPTSMTSLQERYHHKNTRPSSPRNQPIPATPSTTLKSISGSRGGYGGLTHYNSWLVEQPHNIHQDRLSLNHHSQNQNRRYRRRHRH